MSQTRHGWQQGDEHILTEVARFCIPGMHGANFMVHSTGRDTISAASLTWAVVGLCVPSRRGN